MTNGSSAEQMVLGLILYSPEMTSLIMPQVKANYFLKKNRQLFEVINEMHSSGLGIEVMTVLPRIRTVVEWTVAELTSLTDQIVHTGNVQQYINDLKAEYVRRELKLKYDKDIPVYDDVQVDLDAMLMDLEALKQELSKSNAEPIVDICERVYDRLIRQEKSSGLVGLPTQSDRLNRITNGLRGGELIVIAGRPSTGKTAFMLSIICECCKARKRVVLFSMEAKRDEVVERLARAWPDIFNGIGEVSKFDLHIYDIPTDVGLIKSTILDLRNVDLLVIDYLGLMTANSKINRAEAIGEITRGLKALAMKLDIPILLLCQLNRNIENRGEMQPRLSDLRESGDIEQDADKVWFIYKSPSLPTDQLDGIQEQKVNIFIGKNRNGINELTLRMRVTNQFTTFEDDNSWEPHSQPKVTNDVFNSENY